MGSDALAQVRTAGVVPVVVIDDAAHALPLADALAQAGLPIAEVTFRTPAAAAAIEEIARARPDFLVGAGTVLDQGAVVRARDAGARFALAPGYDAEIVDAAAAVGLPFYPGFATPSELSVASRRGCTVLKFFPAARLGGPQALKAILAPFVQHALSVIPTGGVTTETIADWLAVKEVVAVGGTWIATQADLAAGDWAGITNKARRALEAAAAARSTA